MSTLTLTKAEVVEITGYRQSERQRAVLDEQGIPWRDVRGRTIILREHVTAWAEGRPMRRSSEPRLDLVR